MGPGGVLGDITKLVPRQGLEVEMDEHLGYAKHSPAGRDGGNSRNGTPSKTVITEVGTVTIDVPAIATGPSRRRRSANANAASKASTAWSCRCAPEA